MKTLLAAVLAAALGVCASEPPDLSTLPGLEKPADAPPAPSKPRKRHPRPAAPAEKKPAPTQAPEPEEKPAVKKPRKRRSKPAPPAAPAAKPRPARKAKAVKKAPADVPGPTPSGGYAAPHKKRHKKQPVPPAAPARPAGPERVPLSEGRWTPEVRSALERLIAERGKDAPGYDPESPPLAVLSLDALAASHSPGDALFGLLVDSGGYRCDAAFWKLVPVSAGRERIRAGFDAFHSAPKAVWTKDASYLLYRKAFYQAEREVCALWGPRECARWKASLLAGFTVEEATAAAHEAVNRAFELPVGTERVGDYPEDPEPVEVQTGLRRIPEVEDLCLKLKEKGFEVWAMSLSDQGSAAAFAAAYGPPGSPCFEPERVLGIRGAVSSSGTLTAEILSPIPYGTGQSELMLNGLGRTAALAVGGPESRDLFKLADMSVLVVPEGALPSSAPSRRDRYLLQPAFKPVRQPQPPPAR